MKIVLALIVLFVLLLPVGYYFNSPKEKALPILNPVDLNESTVDPELLRMGHGHKIGTFRFQNEHGETITEKDFSGKVWVAEYFFTSCGSICPKMNVQLQRLQAKFEKEEKLQILSFTVDPDTDVPSRLLAYAEKHNAKTPQWTFLTGEKAQLYELARKSFFLLKPSEVPKHGDAGSDFIHTNNFVLIDTQKRIRGYYDGTSREEVDQLMSDISKLLKE
jgi:protein SCO1/2